MPKLVMLKNEKVGLESLDKRNENGGRLTSFCKVNELIFTNTCFKHHKRNRYTWLSSDGNTGNQIDYRHCDRQKMVL